MTRLFYYGVECIVTHVLGMDANLAHRPPRYEKKLWTYVLHEGEDEAAMRKKIEERCRSYPEWYPSYIPPGLRIHFQWVSPGSTDLFPGYSWIATKPGEVYDPHLTKASGLPLN